MHALAGSLALARKDVAAAKAAYNRAFDLDATSLEALTGLVGIDVMSKDLPAARARVDAAVARAPKDPAVLMLAARIYATSGDFTKSEELLRSAIAVDPANLQAYGLLGQLYLVQNKLDQARQEFENAAKSSPRSVAAHTMVGMILQMQGRYEEAQKRYETVLQIDPGAPVAANNLAWLYAERGGNMDVALQLAQAAKSKLKDQPEVNDTLGWIYYKRGLAHLAIPPLQESVAKDPKNPVYRYHLGLALALSGDKVKARDALSQALKLSPNFDGADDARKVLAEIQG